jgi:HrpA-like RNA helicase
MSEIDKERQKLPIFLLRDELLKAVRDHQVIILVGETGCGKTT